MGISQLTGVLHSRSHNQEGHSDADGYKHLDQLSHPWISPVTFINDLQGMSWGVMDGGGCGKWGHKKKLNTPSWPKVTPTWRLISYVYCRCYCNVYRIMNFTWIKFRTFMQSLHLQECFNVFCCFFFLKERKKLISCCRYRWSNIMQKAKWERHPSVTCCILSSGSVALRLLAFIGPSQQMQPTNQRPRNSSEMACTSKLSSRMSQIASPLRGWN